MCYKLIDVFYVFQDIGFKLDVATYDESILKPGSSGKSSGVSAAKWDYGLKDLEKSHQKNVDYPCEVIFPPALDHGRINHMRIFSVRLGSFHRGWSYFRNEWLSVRLRRV